MPQLALVDAPLIGYIYRDLVESRRWITASALEAWLVASGFAEPNGETGRLVPTQRAFDIGLLDFLG